MITGILIDSREKPRRWVTFFARRSLRIFPLYFVTLAIGFWLLPDFLKLQTLSRYQLWAWLYVANIGHTFGYCPDFGHIWSLAVEEQFYLIWPFCVWGVKTNRGTLCVCAATIALAMLSRIIGLSSDVFPAAFTLCRVDALAMGGIVAVLVRQQGDGTRLTPWFWTAFGLSLLAAIPMYILGSGSGSGWQQVVKYSLYGSVYASFIGILVTTSPASRLNRLMSLSALKWFGTYSYCLYLVHPFLMTAFDRWLPAETIASECLRVAGVLVGSMLIARVSWTLLEQPILRTKDRMFPAHDNPEASPHGYKEDRSEKFLDPSLPEAAK